jgi:hypothetical protein
MSSKFFFETRIKQVMKEIEAGARKQRAAAASLIRSKIKKKISDVYFSGHHSKPGEPPGKISGNLMSGLYKFNGKKASFVGFRMPAYHAFLLEFGSTKSNPRMTKGKGAKRKKIRSTGYLAPRPVVYPTFVESETEVNKILSEPWVK